MHFTLELCHECCSEFAVSLRVLQDYIDLNIFPTKFWNLVSHGAPDRLFPPYRLQRKTKLFPQLILMLVLKKITPDILLLIFEYFQYCTLFSAPALLPVPDAGNYSGASFPVAVYIEHLLLKREMSEEWISILANSMTRSKFRTPTKTERTQKDLFRSRSSQ